MIRSKIDVANEALSLVGADRITALDDGSAEGEQVSAHYETVVGLALTAPGGGPYRWTFATRQDRLTRLADAPEARWSCAYQMPPDLLRMHAVTQGGVPVVFTIQRDQVLTNEDGDLVADYTFRPDESAWPPDFHACVVADLGAKLALSLNENAELAKIIRAGIDWRGARTADSQSRSSPRLRATRLTGARFGGRGWRW